MELLRDLHEEYEELEYERGLQRVDAVELDGLIADAVLAAPVAETPPPSSTSAASEERSGLEPPKKRACTRYSTEQIAVLQREFDSGAQKQSYIEIAREIEMIPDGIRRRDRRKVDPSDVGNLQWETDVCKGTEIEGSRCSETGPEEPTMRDSASTSLLLGGERLEEGVEIYPGWNFNPEIPVLTFDSDNLHGLNSGRRVELHWSTFNFLDFGKCNGQFCRCGFSV